MRTRSDNAYRWMLEPLSGLPGYMERPMFGCLAAYLGGRLVAVAADREEPWSGLMLPTSREHHASLMSEHPALSPHPVLGKWLFLASSMDEFEEAAGALIEAIERGVMRGDERVGVEPRPKSKPFKKTIKKARKRHSPKPTKRAHQKSKVE